MLVVARFTLPISVAEREIHGPAAGDRVHSRRTEESKQRNFLCLTTADTTACSQASLNNTQWRRKAP